MPRQKKPGPKPIKGEAMTASERNRRARRRNQIFHAEAKELDLRPLTVYLPTRIIEMLSALESESADSVNPVDRIVFGIIYDWLCSQPEDVKQSLGFDADRDALTMIEIAIAEAAKKIEEEGL